MFEDFSIIVETTRGEAHIVRNVTFPLFPGRVTAIVGESGSGKSSVLRAGLNFLPEGAVTTGKVIYRDKELLHSDDMAVREYRAKDARMVFQDPWTALHPQIRIGRQLWESVHAAYPDRPRGELRASIVDTLKRVGVTDIENRLRSYPHHLSGGQLQRVVISMALLADPKILLCDEPTTALDVTTEAVVLDLLEELVRERDIAIAISTHNLQVVRDIADFVVVMYAGRVVEYGYATNTFENPTHPYTEALLRSAPGSVTSGAKLDAIEGIAPSPYETFSACAFAPRCEHVVPACMEGVPLLRNLDRDPEHWSACVRAPGYTRSEE